MADTAELRIDNQTIELPIVEGSEGERAIDISKLRNTPELITLDSGYANTGSCSSAVRFVDER
jgi:citrate synthase